VGWVRFKIESKPPLSTCAYLSISWFAFVTLGLFGPRRLGVAREHPRYYGVPRKVCNGSIPPPQGKGLTSGRRKRSWKDSDKSGLRGPLELIFVGSLVAPSTESRTRQSLNLVKQIPYLNLPLLSLFVIFVCCLSLWTGYQWVLWTWCEGRNQKEQVLTSWAELVYTGCVWYWYQTRLVLAPCTDLIW
jgi:hypothetical protein